MKPGDSSVTPSIVPPLISFQSTPGYEAGRVEWDGYAGNNSGKFQSTPGYEAGRFDNEPLAAIAVAVFQSTPGYEAGRFP